jgi:hypothetical protein
MSAVFLVSMVTLALGVVIIEVRAIRQGDERQHHAPGYGLVLGGLIMLGIGVAAAASEHTVIALLATGLGLVAVLAGATRHGAAPVH